jgi:hypothetical protein
LGTDNALGDTPESDNEDAGVAYSVERLGRGVGRHHPKDRR